MKSLITKIINRVLILSLFTIGLTYFLHSRPQPFVLGYLFGSSISVLTFLLLKNSVEKSVRMNQHKARTYATIQYFIRMFIIGITLIISAKADYLSFISTLFGVFIIKIVIYLSNILDKNFLQ